MTDLKPYEEFEKLWVHGTSAKENQDEFAGWWGDSNGISRILVRLHIIQKGYKSVVDVGCGFCMDYDSLKRSIADIQYLALDISPTFMEKAIERGIPAELARVQNMPCADSSSEAVIARHLLEHLDSYHDAIKEMVRVASKEVIIVFFMAPDMGVNDKGGMVNIGDIRFIKLDIADQKWKLS